MYHFLRRKTAEYMQQGGNNLNVFAFGCHQRCKWLKYPVRTHGYTPLSFGWQRNQKASYRVLFICTFPRPNQHCLSSLFVLGRKFENRNPPIVISGLHFFVNQKVERATITLIILSWSFQCPQSFCPLLSFFLHLHYYASFVLRGK